MSYAEPSKEKLWKRFSTFLSRRGLKPEDHRAYFDEEWELSLREPPTEDATRLAMKAAVERVAMATSPPVPGVKLPPSAGTFELAIKEFLEGKTDYATYEARVKKIQEKGLNSDGTEGRD